MEDVENNGWHDDSGQEMFSFSEDFSAVDLAISEDEESIDDFFDTEIAENFVDNEVTE